MGHLAIVNCNSIKTITDKHPYISFGGTLGKMPLKTVSDLFADALAVREDDYIFTWMVNDKNSPGIGFDRYFVANGNVVFNISDPDFPIKIGIKSGFQFANPVSEEEALDIFRSPLLWNAIGKKSLGRGRSLSHQTIDEDKLLLCLLHGKNNNVCTKIITNPICNINYIPINISNFNPNPINIFAQNISLNQVPVQSVVWNKLDGSFIFEKTLEAYLCENIDKKNTSFCTLLGYPNYRVKWFGNYLPYGVAGKNIDLVCEIEKDSDSIIVVIELKVGRIGYKEYQRITDEQLNKYTDFINKAFISYRGNSFKIEQVIITQEPLRTLQPKYTQYKNTKWIGYYINTNSNVVTLKRLL